MPYFLKPLKTISVINAEISATYWTARWWHKCFQPIAIQSVIFSLQKRKNTSSKEEWSQTCFQVSRERHRCYFSFRDKTCQFVRSRNTDTALAICQILTYLKVHREQAKEHRTKNTAWHVDSKGSLVFIHSEIFNPSLKAQKERFSATKKKKCTFSLYLNQPQGEIPNTHSRSKCMQMQPDSLNMWEASLSHEGSRIKSI